MSKNKRRKRSPEWHSEQLTARWHSGVPRALTWDTAAAPSWAGLPVFTHLLEFGTLRVFRAPQNVAAVSKKAGSCAAGAQGERCSQGSVPRAGSQQEIKI